MIFFAALFIVIIVVFIWRSYDESSSSESFSSISNSKGRYSSLKNRKDITLKTSYIKEFADVSKSFYSFLYNLAHDSRCVGLLNELPGMDQINRNPAAYKAWTINPRLAIMVYCDLVDCYKRLGHNPSKLSGLSGIGFAMMVGLLIVRGLEFRMFYTVETAVKVMEVISKFVREDAFNLEITGHESQYRFAVVMGYVNDEHEWVEQYATLMYRWASLIAKADGKITSSESAALASILNLAGKRYNGNVTITNRADEKPNKRVEVSNANIINSNRKNQKDEFEIEPEVSDSEKSLLDIMHNLDLLIGLKPVKEEVKALVSFIQIQRKRRFAGLREAPVSYHCVFTGNPGTGKTTVARILADIYRELGVVKKGHLVETDRSGLVAEYVGQTAVKTNKLIDSALDGVLFIDEAYTLVQGGSNDYGAEAIATLLKRMEDDRNRLVVILAGYTDEMKAFIDSNPGLQSRFSRYIEFPDYSAQELSEMFLMTADRCQYICDDELKAKIVQVMQEAQQNKDKCFGNGRFVRNLFEKAIQHQAVRLSSVVPITTEMLKKLTFEDVE